jgi:hypothetical protein
MSEQQAEYGTEERPVFKFVTVTKKPNGDPHVLVAVQNIDDKVQATNEVMMRLNRPKPQPKKEQAENVVEVTNDQIAEFQRALAAAQNEAESTFAKNVELAQMNEALLKVMYMVLDKRG